jgi:hypothetical protein
MTVVRDDGATTACPVCGTAFEPKGRQKFCSTGCRQSAWRAGRRAPVEPVVTRSGTVYECPACEARYLGEQRCGDCNTWCRRLGPGALCPQRMRRTRGHERPFHQRPAREGPGCHARRHVMATVATPVRARRTMPSKNPKKPLDKHRSIDLVGRADNNIRII